jgi:hypothetical protein
MSTTPAKPRSLIQRVLIPVVALLVTYFVIAYVILPLTWKTDEAIKRHRHPALDEFPKVTQNADGIPGGPLNVALIGDKSGVVNAMLAAGWKPADAITLDSSIKIAVSVVFDRPDPNAPVSNLYVFGRKQDLAFEQEIGSSADRRHHVRWWKCEPSDRLGNECWIGAVSLDIGSGVSHLTGQITHHISPDVDAQRDLLMADLNKAGQLAREYQIVGMGPTKDGRNAGGDPYHTDGMLDVGVLKAAKQGN